MASLIHPTVSEPKKTRLHRFLVLMFFKSEKGRIYTSATVRKYERGLSVAAWFQFAPMYIAVNLIAQYTLGKILPRVLFDPPNLLTAGWISAAVVAAVAATPVVKVLKNRIEALEPGRDVTGIVGRGKAFMPVPLAFGGIAILPALTSPLMTGARLWFAHKRIDRADGLETKAKPLEKVKARFSKPTDEQILDYMNEFLGTRAQRARLGINDLPKQTVLAELAELAIKHSWTHNRYAAEINTADPDYFDNLSNWSSLQEQAARRRAEPTADELIIDLDLARYHIDRATLLSRHPGLGQALKDAYRNDVPKEQLERIINFFVATSKANSGSSDDDPTPPGLPTSAPKSHSSQSVSVKPTRGDVRASAAARARRSQNPLVPTGPTALPR